ncbi:hypothetical protein ACFLQI_03550, partial [Candidatus Undinarchaeota archaeon]
YYKEIEDSSKADFNFDNTAPKAQYNVPVNVTLETGLIFNNDVDSHVFPMIDVSKSAVRVWKINSTSSTGVFDVTAEMYGEVLDIGQVTVQ